MQCASTSFLHSHKMLVLRNREKGLIKTLFVFVIIGFIVVTLVLTKPSVDLLIGVHSESTRRFAREASVCPKLHFSQVPLPTTALASFPGSGNTWFRHILHRFTGIATGAIYHDQYLMEKGFIGEKVTNGSVVAIKTHINYDTTGKFFYDRAIILMRNPYEAILSFFKFKNSRGNKHTAHINLDVFIRNWLEPKMLTRYHLFHLSWLNQSDSHVIFYDDLRTNMREALTNLEEYLALPTSCYLDCVFVNSEGNFHRNNSKGMPTSFYFSREQRVELNRIILDLKDKYVSKFHLETHPFDNWLMDENV